MSDTAPEIRNEVSIQGKGKDAVISVKPLKVNVTGQEAKVAAGEPLDVLRVSQKPGKDIDTHTLFEKAWTVIKETGEGAKTSKALTDDEIVKFNEILDKFPGGAKDQRRALRKDIAKMTLSVDKDNSAQAWKDLSDPAKAGKAAVENPELSLVFNYIKESGGNPKNLNWKVVVAYSQALVEGLEKGQKTPKATLELLAKATTMKPNEQDDLYQKLLAREGYIEAKTVRKGDKKTWENQTEREKAFDLLLGLRQPEIAADPVRFLKQEFYRLALEPRLTAMRSSAVASLDKSGEQQKIMIDRPKDKDHFEKGFSPALVFQTVSDETKIGKFLDEIGKGAYWRGKACLDVLYWSFYKGQIMSDKESLAESKDADIFSSRKELSHTLRRYAGAVALSYMEKDPRFINSLNILYNLNPGMSYEQKLKILSEQYGNFDIHGELPEFVTDAVMFEKVFVLDALNMSRADLRIVAYTPAQIFDKELATDAQGQVLQFLGKNMRLTESPLIKMGWFDANNARFNYEAMVPDLREYNPEKFWDQKDKIWQHCYMFLLELNDRRHDLTRKFTSENEEIEIEGRPMTATPGQTGEYLNYQNERRKRNKGESEWNYDHRRGVFERIQAMQSEDVQSRTAGGAGKAGWDERINPNNPRGLTVRQAVDAFVIFMQRDYSGPNQLVINGATIDKGANEIFYNDELATLLNEFEANPNNPAFARNKNELFAFLNMRDVLRDHRCWGFVFDLNDQEVHKRLFNNMDITFVENYDIAASESKNLISELTKARAYEDIYALEVDPDKVLKAIEAMNHRRHGSQNYWPMYRLLQFIEGAMMRRLTEMEIASAKDLLQMVDPMGQVQLGAEEKVKKLLGIIDDTWEARNSILGEIESIGYMEEMTLSRLELQKRGLLGNWEEAIRAHALRELYSEAFNWGLTRTLPLEQQAGIDDELAAGWQFIDREKKSMFPIQSWQVPDAHRNEDGEYIIEPLAIQGINRVQYHEYFLDLRVRPDGIMGDRDYGLQQAGNVFGGTRKATVILQPGGYFSTGPKEHKPKRETNDFKTDQERGAVIIQESIDESRQKWLKIGIEEVGEIRPVGWIRENMLKITAYGTQSFSAPLRPGEVRYDGGRFFWRHFEKDKPKRGEPEQWKWIWVKGHWGPDKKRQDLIFQPSPDGFERKLQVGTPQSVEVLIKEADKYDKDVASGRPVQPLLFDKNLLGEDFLQTLKDGLLQEANYPFMIFINPEKRREFYSGRGRMLFSLRMGNPIGATKSVGFQAGTNLPGWMYRSQIGNLGQMSRFGDEMLKMMRLQIRIGIYRGGLATEIERHFGKVYLPDETIAKLKKTYEKAMTGEQWAEDIKIMRGLMAETPLWSVLFNKDIDFKKSAKSRFWVDLGNGLLKIGSAFLRMKLPIEALPLNVPVALTTVGLLGGLAWIGSVGFARAAVIVGAVGGLTSYLVGMLGVGFSSLIRPDLSRLEAGLFNLPKIKNFHAWTPIE